jgi:hypothetical protein
LARLAEGFNPASLQWESYLIAVLYPFISLNPCSISLAIPLSCPDMAEFLSKRSITPLGVPLHLIAQRPSEQAEARYS